MDLFTIIEYDKALLLALNGSNSAFLDHVVLVFTSGLTWIPMYISLLYLVVKNNEKWSRIFLIAFYGIEYAGKVGFYLLGITQLIRA